MVDGGIPSEVCGKARGSTSSRRTAGSTIRWRALRPGRWCSISASVRDMPRHTEGARDLRRRRVLHGDDPRGPSRVRQEHFSANRDEDGVTVAQIQSLARANGPVYEIGFRVVGATEQERIWTHALKSLAAHFGVNEPDTLEKACVDPKVQWSQIKNLWHNAGARSVIYTMAGPGRWVRGLMRRRNT
jgi:hypothetical protein